MSRDADDTLKLVNRAIAKGIGNTISKKNMAKYGNSLADDIKKRTRLGKGVKENFGKTHKLKPLTSNDYVEQRYDDKEAGRLSPYTSPERSNLTRTGQLLDSIRSKVISDNKFEIYVKDSRRDGVKNSDIIDGQEDQGRFFLYASNLEYKRIRDQFRKDIQENMLKK